MPANKPPYPVLPVFDEAQVFAASDRAIRRVQEDLDRLRREGIQRLGAGQRVVLTVDGVTVATFEPWR